jgi:hypothetical protein
VGENIRRESVCQRDADDANRAAATTQRTATELESKLLWGKRYINYFRRKKLYRLMLMWDLCVLFSYWNRIFLGIRKIVTEIGLSNGLFYFAFLFLSSGYLYIFFSIHQVNDTVVNNSGSKIRSSIFRQTNVKQDLVLTFQFSSTLDNIATENLHNILCRQKFSTNSSYRIWKENYLLCKLNFYHF